MTGQNSTSLLYVTEGASSTMPALLSIVLGVIIIWVILGHGYRNIPWILPLQLSSIVPSTTLHDAVNFEKHLPIFPQLKVTSESTHPPIDVPPNSRKAVEFETPFFKGRILMLFKTRPIDPYYKHMFEGHRMRFDVQLQGGCHLCARVQGGAFDLHFSS